MPAIASIFVNHPCIQVPLQKAVDSENGGLLQDATQMKTDVLSAVHFIAEA
jgi:hypothetical protein